MGVVYNPVLSPAVDVWDIVQPRLTSKLAIATSAQRPSTPVQQRAIELIERLMGPALAVSRTG